MKKPTKRQQAYAEARAKGISQKQSAIMVDGGEGSGRSKLEGSPTVQQELARLREETIKNTGVTKEDVVEMLMNAANMAKMMADPAGLVAAARELGKMLGFYAPEVKKTLVGVDQAQLKQALADMSEEELLRIANASRTFDGEAVLIEDNSGEKVS